MILSNPKKLDFICAISVKGIMNHLLIFKKTEARLWETLMF